MMPASNDLFSIDDDDVGGAKMSFSTPATSPSKVGQLEFPIHLELLYNTGWLRWFDTILCWLRVLLIWQFVMPGLPAVQTEELTKAKSMNIVSSYLGHPVNINLWVGPSSPSSKLISKLPYLWNSICSRARGSRAWSWRIRRVTSRGLGGPRRARRPPTYFPSTNRLPPDRWEKLGYLKYRVNHH